MLGFFFQILAFPREAMKHVVTLLYHGNISLYSLEALGINTPRSDSPQFQNFIKVSRKGIIVLLDC